MDARTQLIGTRVTPAVYEVIARMAATQHKSMAKVASELLERALITADVNDSNPLSESVDKLDGKISKLVQELSSLREKSAGNWYLLSKILKVAGGANCYAQFAATYTLALNRSMRESRRLDDALEDESLQNLMPLAAEYEDQLQSDVDKHLKK